MIFSLNQTFQFPDPALAEPDGLLAVGGDLRPGRLLAAYSNGIFPWYSDEEPILWWSPDPRLILFPEKLNIPRDLAQLIRQNKFRITFNAAFQQVISLCASTPRKDGAGTWINPAMQEAYYQLHLLGHAMSVETWLDDRLVGGLYGVMLPAVFCGESMFHLESNASKVALVALAHKAIELGWRFIDCQLPIQHLQKLGAETIGRADYLVLLDQANSGV